MEKPSRHLNEMTEVLINNGRNSNWMPLKRMQQEKCSIASVTEP